MRQAVKAPLDIVYPVRAGDDNDELRYSLRTVEVNFPHGEVWIVGHKPSWLVNVNHIRGNNRPYMLANVYANVLTACEHSDTPNRFVVFNDDFFVTAPAETDKVFFRCDLRQHLRMPRIANNQHSWWSTSLASTWNVLRDAGHRNPVSYELHVPFPVDKYAMGETLRKFVNVSRENPPQWRTLYGNIHSIGGRQMDDCKVTRPGPIKTPFHSTDDGSWRRYYSEHFKVLYPEPSRYEKR